MSHQVFGFGGGNHKQVEYLVEWLTIFHGMFGGDAVHHLCIDGDDKAIGLNKIVMVLHKATFLVMDLPSQLHHAWPIVKVGQRSVFYFGKTSGLCIED